MFGFSKMSFAPVKRSRGKPFTKNDPRRQNSKGGRPRKTVTWKEAEDTLRAAVPELLLMTEAEITATMKDPKTVLAYSLAYKYINEEPKAAVDKFLGKTPTVFMGPNGAPLVPTPGPGVGLPPIDFKNWSPKQIDKYLELLAPAKVSGAPAAVALPPAKPGAEGLGG